MGDAQVLVFLDRFELAAKVTQRLALFFRIAEDSLADEHQPA